MCSAENSCHICGRELDNSADPLSLNWVGIASNVWRMQAIPTASLPLKLSHIQSPAAKGKQ